MNKSFCGLTAPTNTPTSTLNHTGIDGTRITVLKSKAMVTDTMTKANPLQSWLTKKGLSRADFAKLIGTTETAVGRYCTGRRLPDRDIMRRIKLATKGGVTADDFYK